MSDGNALIGTFSWGKLLCICSLLDASCYLILPRGLSCFLGCGQYYACKVAKSAALRFLATWLCKAFKVAKSGDLFKFISYILLTIGP